MSGNQGAWGVAMYKDGHAEFLAQEAGISLEGGDPVLPYLPTIPVGSLLIPPAGLGVPGVRSGDVAFAQRDGVVQFADYYEPRQITLSVLVKNDDCPGCSSSPGVEAALVLDGVSPGRASTPSSPALNIVGDLDVRAHVALDDWTPATAQAVIGKWAAAGTRSWLFQVHTTGQLRFFWSVDGTATLNALSTIAPSIADGQDLWVGVKFDVNNGAGGRTVRFFTSTDGFNWNQLGGDVTTAGVTSIFAGSAALEVGANTNGTQDRLAGRVFSAEVLSGIDGTVVASPNFDQPAGTTSFVDDQGNPWTVFAPGFLQPFVAPKMSARQKVSRLTQEWSRNCSGATLVLFTDCHDPNATEEEKVYLGPYMVRGRPRVADVVWERSNRGAARVTLRFDAADARLVLADTIPGALWTSEHVQSVDAVDQNMIPDPELLTRTMSLNGATVVDTHPLTGGPGPGDGGPYFSRLIQAPNTTSPMLMALAGVGLAAIPVVAGTSYTVAWWARKNPGGGPASRLDWQWYDGAGAALSVNNGAAMSPGATWQRFSQTNVAPVGAAFAQPRLVWTGTALTDQVLDVAQPWMNDGVTAEGPLTVEIEGTLCAYPVISLFPTMTAPIIVTYGGHQFTYTANVTTVIDIDTRWGRASDGSLDVTENLEGDFSSPLEPGIHEVTVQTGDLADTGFVNVVWENSVVSG